MLRARRLDFGFPTEAPGHPVDTVAAVRGAGEGTGGDRGRGLRAGLGASLRDRCGQGGRGRCAPGCRIPPVPGSGGPGCGTWRPPRTPSWNSASTWRARGSRRSPWSRRRITGGSGSSCWRSRGLEMLAGQRPRRQERPGPPEDRSGLDAVWLAKLTERGMLRPSFVPPLETDPRTARPHPVARAVMTHERTRHKQRTEKLLEQAQIKLSTVIAFLTSIRRLGTRDAGSPDRRRAQPQGPRGPGPRHDQGQPRHPRRGPDRAFRRAPRRSCAGCCWTPSTTSPCRSTSSPPEK